MGSLAPWLFASDPPSSPIADALLLPAGFQPPLIPPGNPLSKEKIALGRELFYETRMAVDGITSCASCHIQARAFTDGKPHAIGATGGQHPRATMSLTNVGYNASLTWADPSLDKLENQAEIPLFNQHPIEMGLQGRLEEVLVIFANEKRYQSLFEAAFPNENTPNLSQITRALASFQRTMTSFSSTFDAIMMEDAHPPERAVILRGMSLFFSNELNCSKCHGGFNFSGPVSTDDQRSFPTFHHNGLLGQSPSQDERQIDPGLASHTGQPRDWGKFRAPTLRNIAVTAPYMHKGQLPTLAAVLDHYAQGGQPFPQDGVAGKDHPNKSPFIRPFKLTSDQREDLLTFLKSLTDKTFLNRPDLSNPNPGELP